MTRSRALAALGTLVTAAWALGTACRDRDPAAPEPLAAADSVPRRVFLITVDTLRADHLPFHGYPRPTAPRLAALAERSVVFERAIAQWPKTGASFASLFSGRYPQTTGLTHAAAIEPPPDVLTLPEFFHRQGFTTAAVMSNPVLTRRLGWARHFDEYLETWGDGVPSDDPAAMRPWIDAAKVNGLALPLLDRLRDRPKLFVWIHYSDPHAPYILPAGVANPFLADAVFAGAPHELVPRPAEREMRLGVGHERRFYVAQYDANIQVADRAIGAVWQRLGELGLLEESLLVFLSDHGESLGEHDSWFEHGPTPHNTTSHVPLFFLFSDGRPPARPARVAEPVELVDVYPTLRDLVAPQSVIEGLEGRTLLVPDLATGASRFASPTGHAFAEAGQRRRHHYRSIQEGRYKLIYDPDPANLAARAQLARAWQLYDLEADPLETRDLLRGDDAPPPDLRRLRATLLAWARVPPSSASDEEAAERDREVRKALRALGYVQ